MLSERRRQAALELRKDLEEEIRSLRMDPARFEIPVRPSGSPESPSISRRGRDDVEFLLSTNIGEEPKPLHRIASGGELSRIILAMKKVLVRGGSVGTIVFDEVDSGIGGATAEVVGERIGMSPGVTRSSASPIFPRLPASPSAISGCPRPSRRSGRHPAWKSSPRRSAWRRWPGCWAACGSPRRPVPMPAK